MLVNFFALFLVCVFPLFHLHSFFLLSCFCYHGIFKQFLCTVRQNNVCLPCNFRRFLDFSGVDKTPYDQMVRSKKKVRLERGVTWYIGMRIPKSLGL